MVLHLALFAALFGAAQAPEPNPNESLFRAIQRADTTEVERLLQNGGSPNAVNADGDPALMVATLFADSNSMEALLRYGADPEQANAVGATPLMWAIPDLGKIRLLIDHGADVNARTSTLERTPFLIASSYPGSAEVLGLLLAHGADIRATDAGGADALRLAIRSASRPAQLIAIRHLTGPAEVPTTRPPRSTRAPCTRRPVMMAPPARHTTWAIARVTSAKSTMPVSPT